MITNDPSDCFRIEERTLIRSVVPRRGNPYEHACTEAVFKDTAYAIEERGARTFTADDIRAAIDAPFTQVAVAIAFLKERGCIVPARERRHQAASDFVYEDALIEYHALREPENSKAAKDEQP